MTPVNIGETARTERAYGLLVSDGYFDVLRLRPAAGRFFTEAETLPGAGPDVVVVSYEFWRDRLGRAPLSTQTVRASGRDLRVVGVTPDGFQGTVLGLQFDLWLPAVAAPALLAGSAELESRTVRGYYVMGRLPASADLTRASAAVASEMADLQARFPEANRGVAGEVLPFWRASRGPQGFLVQSLAVVQGVLLLLLLAVCGNTANLLLARASQRQREVGVRLAVGGGPWRVGRLLLLETALMALAGALGGTLLAAWSARATRAMPLITTAFPVRFDASLDATTLAFAIGLALAATLVAGTLPALHLARLDPLAAVRGEAPLLGRTRLRNWLMAAEVAVALVVLLVAGTLLSPLRGDRSRRSRIPHRGRHCWPPTIWADRAARRTMPAASPSASWRPPRNCRRSRPRRWPRRSRSTSTGCRSVRSPSRAGHVSTAAPIAPPATSSRPATSR